MRAKFLRLDRISVLTAVVTILGVTYTFSAKASNTISPDQLVEITNQIENQVVVGDTVDMGRLHGTVESVSNLHRDIRGRTFIYSADAKSIEYKSTVIDGRNLIVGTIHYNGPRFNVPNPISGVTRLGNPPRVLVFTEDGTIIADARINISMASTGYTSEMAWSAETANEMRLSEKYLSLAEKRTFKKVAAEFNNYGESAITQELITDLKRASPRVLEYLGKLPGPLGKAVLGTAAIAGISTAILNQASAAEADKRQETMFGKKKSLSEALQQHDEENSGTKPATSALK